MKIAVVGAGIIGVTTAYELTLDGHEVTVFEKNTSVAELASFATGGSMAASLTQAFSHTVWPKSSSLMRLIGNAAALPFHGLFNAATAGWLLAWSKAQTAEQFQTDFCANASLLSDSIARLGDICHKEKIEFEQSSGQLVLLHSEAESKTNTVKLAALKELGITHSMLNTEEIAKAEPSLHQSNDMQSAVYFPGDVVGNCRQFAQMLKDRAVEAGATFVFNSAVTSVKHGPQIELGVAGTQATSQFDGVVFCTGGAWTELTAFLKVKVPLIEAYGYTLSAQMHEPLNGPRSAVFDTPSQIGISRIGSRIRASGRAYIGRPNARGAKKAQEQLYRAIQNHFPGAATLSHGTQFWSGGTLITVDAMPVIGETELQGVYLNIGHGFNGWGMACGSARLLAESVGKTAQAKRESVFSPRRFKR